MFGPNCKLSLCNTNVKILVSWKRVLSGPEIYSPEQMNFRILKIEGLFSEMFQKKLDWKALLNAESKAKKCKLELSLGVS